MAISFGPSDFLDKFNTGKFMATSGRADAIERANAFTNSARVGGEGVTQIARNEATDRLKNAQQSAQSITNTAGAISGGLNLLGSVGSFGAAGGFGGGGGVPGDGGAAAGFTTPWDKSYDYFKDAPSFMGEGFSIPSYDFTSPFTN